MLLFFSFAMLVAVIFLIKKSPFIKAHFNLIAQNKKLTKSSKNFFHIFLMPNSSSLKTYALKKFRETLFKAKETALQKEKIVLFFCAFVFIFLSFIFSISLLYFVINLPSLFAGSVVLTILATTFFFKAFLHIEEDFKEFFRCVPSFEALMEASGKYQEKEKFQYSPSEYWPQKASLRIMALSCKAMGNFPHDLKNLDLFIPHAGRFGILEEKNSKETNTLFASVMLLTPYEDGSIILDDEDLRKINPVHLRERLGYISGNSFFPFLSIRENVDPFEQFDDSEIWSVLNRVGIAPSVALLRNGLNTTIEEILNPLVWSGELVFFSFARSLLQENKILLIENIPVSEEIELRINDLIHREFSNATVLICASAKSSLFNICHHLARFENDSLRRASLEKTAYHSTQPFFPEGSEIPKIL
jgi:ABC-type multidrug transport system fused ATPase/permease subunit